MSPPRRLAALSLAAPVLFGALVANAHAAAGSGESIEQALCRLIETAAARSELPVEFMTRLLWQESSFRPGVISAAGAQGIAQFMPGTARERGLQDPFDPEQAIPASAALLKDLQQRFGNRGLAAAAYNAGPGRVSAWLAGTGSLPLETQGYVIRTTGRPAEAWQADAKAGTPPPPPMSRPKGCVEVAREIRATVPMLSTIALAAVAPWGVQLAGNFSKALALASFERARGRYQAIVGDLQPMIIGTRLRTRGFRPFYRVRLPAQTRTEGNALCARIQSSRGACVVLRS